MKRILISSTAILVIFMLGLTGCALTEGKAKIEYAPQATGSSPLSLAKPMKIDLRVEDKRPPSEMDHIADKENNFGMKMASIKSTSDVVKIINDALRGEFSSNGHTVIDRAAGQPDLIVKVELKRFWGNSHVRAMDIETVGVIYTEVSIIDPKTNNVIFTKPLTTTARRTEQMGSTGAIERVMNDAIKEFVRNFSRDPGIIKALKNASQGAGA